MTSCVDCGGTTSWDDDVCSVICTSCGTLQDPTQSVLASHLDQHDNSARQYNPLWDPATSSTLKSLRGRNGWDLAGQGKEARDRKNMVRVPGTAIQHILNSYLLQYAMQEFIRSICSRLSSPGIIPRAVTLFTRAMTQGRYRWGRKAKLTAGASISISLRELRKADSLLDIASIIDESANSLARAFTRVVTLLQLDLPSADPAAYLSTLQSHLNSLINSSAQPSPLPLDLHTQLKGLSLLAVIQTATLLCTLLTSLTSFTAYMSAPATSCAILIISLEAEIRTSLSCVGELAQLLAARFGLTKGVVMSRYKIVCDLLEEWIREVPWLEQFETKRKEKGRSKLAKRVIVARGIKDVVQFQEEIWRKKVEMQGKLDVELEEEEFDDKSDDGSLSNTTGSSSSRVNMPSRESCSSLTHSRKRRKIQHQGLEEASKFLLDPLNSALPEVEPSRQASIIPETFVSPRSLTPPPLPLTSYLLTASPTSISLHHRPTRLQLLVAQRSGGADDVDDEELFSDGELESILRSDNEIENLRVALGWEEGAELLDDYIDSRPKETGLEGTLKKPSKSRVNMDALARVLQSDSIKENDEFCDFVNADSLEVVEDWRPPSPDAYDGMDRYDEEC